MPATPGRLPQNSIALGVDGCRNGWVAAIVDPSNGVRVEVFTDFSTVLVRHPFAMIIVDMPIGLADEGRRGCERLAREALGRRRSSVFPAPRRGMLAFDDYAAANAWGKAQGSGVGLTRQAWNILPKIREIDAAITAADQIRLGEGHPELAFRRLSGAPCRHPKRRREGVLERLAILKRNGITAEPLIAHARFEASLLGARAGADDALDACALALAARARLQGRAMRLSDDARDRRGLVMEIWG